MFAFTITNVIAMEINITKLERENMLSKKKGDENQKEQMGYELVPLENIDTTTEPISETNIRNYFYFHKVKNVKFVEWVSEQFANKKMGILHA